MVPFDFVTGVVGVAGLIYGYMRPGIEDRRYLLMTGLKIGVAIGFIIGVFDFFMNDIFAGGSPLLELVGSTAKSIDILINIIFLTIVFLVGTFVGDFLEFRIKK